MKKWNKIKKDWAKENAVKKLVKDKHICAVPCMVINHAAGLVTTQIDLLGSGTWRIVVKKKRGKKCHTGK